MDFLNEPLSYEMFNNILYDRHPNLSSEWTDVVTSSDGTLEIFYPMEDGSEEKATITVDGELTVTEKLIDEMVKISEYYQ